MTHRDEIVLLLLVHGKYGVLEVGDRGAVTRKRREDRVVQLDDVGLWVLVVVACIQMSTYRISVGFKE